MTDEESPSAAPEEVDPDQYWERRNAVQPDNMLADLVEAAEEKGEGGAVTLTVGGVLVTGNMVSRRRWADAHDERWPELGRLTARWREGWDQYDELWDPYRATRTPVYVAMIHLTDARIVTPSGEMPAGEARQGMLWRGRLSEVQGWCLGRLAVTVQTTSSEVRTGD